MIKWLLILVCLAGCSQAPPKAGEPVILNYSEKSIPMDAARQWANAIEKHTHSSDFVLVVVHGGPKKVNGEQLWFCAPDKPRIAMDQNEQMKALFNAYWPKPLWLVSCNEGAFDLTVPNVHYARRIVWSTPTNRFNFWRGTQYAGDPAEFVEFGRVKLAGER